VDAHEKQNPTADEIRAEMQYIRRDLWANVKGMVANASQMFDWKNYVRSFPWASVGVAAALGYLLVPRRPRIVAYDKNAVERVLHDRNLVIAPETRIPKSQTSLVGGLLRVAALAALKIGVSYATRRGMEMITASDGAHAPRTSRPGYSPAQGSPPAAKMVGRPD
jgi:hypothetical protein